MAVRRGSARAIVGLAALLGALLVCAALGQTVGAQREQITTTLHPGWNMIGWIHEETPASDLFEQLDSLESVYDGSGQSALRPAADSDSLTLQPGQGYWLRIDAEQPLEWARPAEPSTLRFQLEAGDQLVAWAGPSDRAIDDVLLGLRDQISVAWRWLAAEQRFAPWSPSPDVPAVEMPAVDRGDAVLVNLTEGVEWLHPTGDLPRIEFPGGLHQDLPDNFRELVEGDLRLVVERFAAKFQFEVPADRLHLRVPTTPEAFQLEQQNAGTTGDEYGAGWAHPSNDGQSFIVMPWWHWSVGNCEGTPHAYWSSCSVLAHEYFHIMQRELSGPMPPATPSWLREGTAIWAEWLLFDRSLPDFDEIQSRSDEFDLEAPADLYAHALGEVATAFLVRRAGIKSIVDFWRSFKFDPQIDPNLSWKAGFARTFGITYPEFVAEFYEYRRPLFTVVNGRVITKNTSLRSSVYIRSVNTSFSPLESNVASDGRFSLHLPREAAVLSGSGVAGYDLFVGFTGNDNCVADVLPDGAVGWLYPEGTALSSLRFTLPADVETIDGFDIRVPDSFCQRRLILEMTGPYGLSSDLEARYCSTDGCWWSGMTRDAPRKFVGIVPLVGNYQIELRTPDHDSGWCRAFATANGLVPEHAANSAAISVTEEVTTVRVQLDSARDICTPDAQEE